MYELVFFVYLLAVLSVAYYAIKHSGLLVKSPTVQLQEKRALVEEAMRILNSMSCHNCGSRDTYVEKVDLFQSNNAIVKCNHCKQKAMWKLENHVWHLVAPYRYVPTLPTTPASTITHEPKEEEITLEFSS